MLHRLGDERRKIVDLPFGGLEEEFVVHLEDQPRAHRPLGQEPLAGQGLNLGLADVAELARQIAGRESWRSPGDEKVLQRYVRARALPTQAMGWVTDGLLRLFAQPHPLARELRNRGLTLLDRMPPIKRALVRQAMDA